MRHLTAVLSCCLFLPVAAVAGQGAPAPGAPPEVRDVEGWVKDVSGKPLAGAEVWRYQYDSSFKEPRSWSRVATSDQQGRFTFGQALGRVKDAVLKACLQGYAPGTITLGALDSQDSPWIRLEPARRISGWIVDPAGRPVHGARVRLVESNCDPICIDTIPYPASPCREGDSAVAYVAGAFTLEPLPAGSHQLTAEAPGYLPLSDRGPKAVAGSAGVTLVLSPAMRVHGRVSDAEGRPLAGARVLLSTCELYESVVTGGDGQYEIACAKPERQWVFVTHAGYEATKVQVPAVQGDQRVDLKLTVPWLAVHGRVLGPLGVPVAKAQIMEDGISFATTGADGSFSMLVSRSQLADLTVEKKGYVSTSLDAAPDTDLEVRLEQGAVVTGALLGLPDNELRHARVFLESDQSRFYEADLQLQQDSEGRWAYELSGVPPGAYRLRARSMSFLEIGRTITVGPGEATVRGDLVFPPSFEVQGRVLDPPAGVRVDVRFRSGEMSECTVMKPDGSFAATLPEGRWQMEAESAFSPVQLVSGTQDLVVSGAPVEGLELRLSTGAVIDCHIPGVEEWDRFWLQAAGAPIEPKRGWIQGGACSLAGLAPGDWEITAAMERELKMRGRSATRRITIEPGSGPVNLGLDLRLGRWTLSGWLAPAVAGGYVVAELTSPEAPDFFWQSDLTHGTFTFPRLQEGRYRLRIVRGHPLDYQELLRWHRMVEEQGSEILHERSVDLTGDLEMQIDLGRPSAER